MLLAKSEFIVGVLSLNVVFVIGTNQHLICKTVDDVFAGETPHTNNTPRILHGPPGKRGQKGVKGEPGVTGLKGEKGLPGLVDPENIQNIIKEKLREENVELHGRIETLERLVTNMSSSLNDIIHRLDCADDVFYRKKCYFAIIHSTNDVTYPEVAGLCSGRGGTPADILNREHEDLIVKYIQKKRSAGTYLFLGMTFVPSTSTILWSNGVKVPDKVVAALRFYPGYIFSGANFDKMILGVASGSIGIYNYRSTYNRHGVLCEK